MSHINLDNLLQLIPAGSLPLVSEHSNIIVNENLKEQVIALIIENIQLSDEEKSQVSDCIERFIGENATFTNLHILKHDLQWIYNYLISLNDSDDIKKNQKISMIGNLIVDMGPDLCTEGFFNRVENLVNIISTPKSFTELVSKVCIDLVTQCASEFIDNLKRNDKIPISDNKVIMYNQGYEIHYAKVFLYVAYLHDFGVPYQDVDPYIPLIPELECFILKQLTGFFNANFTEFYLFWNLFNKLKVNLHEAYGYYGVGNYNYNESQAFYNFLTRLELAPKLSEELSEEEQGVFYSYFITEELDIGGKIIHDLNWEKIKCAFTKHFLSKNFCTFSVEQKKSFTQLFLEGKSENYECLLQGNLISSKEEFYYFIKNLEHLDNGLKKTIYNDFIKIQDFSYDDWKSILLQFIYDDNFIENLIDPYREVVRFHRNLFLEIHNDSNFFIEALKTKNEKYMKLAFLQLKCLSPEDQVTLLSHVSSKYSLMLAIMYYPKIALELINILSLSKDLLLDVVFANSVDGTTAFILATKHPEIFNRLLGIIEEVNVFETRFNLRSNVIKAYNISGNSILLNLISENPDLLENFLIRISNMPDISLAELFMPRLTSPSPETPLHVAAHENPESFMKILPFIENVATPIRKNIYLQRDSANLNCFHYLTVKAPEKAQVFLKCLIRDLDRDEQTPIYEILLTNRFIAPDIFDTPEHEIVFKNILIANDIAKLDSGSVLSNHFSKWQKRFLEYLNSTDEAQKNIFLEEWESFKSSTPNLFSRGSAASSSFFFSKRSMGDGQSNERKRHREYEP